ncbi:MAG: DUF2520 domain-containing protein [Deltaproteobacteria bacterium]|jgi:predicted short-subunit dehydrogenase-like oxidoreductase (DUF2520 family)|nr:DUF2520 domain-containing protein [Deltaproteobacteria bacterium]
MKIGFIGAGKVGFCLGQYFKEKGLSVVGYASQSPEPAQEAARLTNSRFFSDRESLLQAADLIFLTVPDRFIGQVFASLVGVKGKIFAHCSGSLASDVLARARERGGEAISLHPLMAISDKYRSRELLAGAFFAIEGDEPALTQVKNLIASLGNEVQILDKTKKTLYHCAASVVSNFAVALAFMGSELLDSCGLGGAKPALFRLALNNAKNIAEYGPVDALTGPVERGDVSTVADHLAALSGEDRQLYRLLARKLLRVAQLKRVGQDYAPLAQILENP